MTPPVIEKPSSEDLWKLVKIGRKVRGLGKQEMMRLLRWGPMAVADFVAEFFETDLLRAVVAARGIFGSAMGPWSAGSTALLLLRAAADSYPVGNSAMPKGGMGGLTAAMAAAAKQAGVEIRTVASVSRILVKNGVVIGVALGSGEEIAAKTIVSGVDPRRTFLALLDPVHLPPSFVVKMQNYRCSGTIAKLNLALDCAALVHCAEEFGRRRRCAEWAHPYRPGNRLPRARIRPFEVRRIFRGALSGCDDSHASRSFARAGSEACDVDLHAVRAVQLKTGDWSAKDRDALRDTIVRTLSAYAPDLASKILAAQLLTPKDLEDEYGLTGGHPFHGELSLDQLFTMRPQLGWARYRTPVQGLYLCSNGTHPGNGLTGASGANAAREILKDIRK